MPRVATARVIEAEPAAAVVPGPLRILVAVAVPGDDLDVEHEMGVILDAADRLRVGRARVVFIDEAEATLAGIRQQLDAEPFHVLHVSAHGGPGVLQLEGEQGESVRVSAEALAELLRTVRHTPPVVVLSACSTAAAPGQGDGLDRIDVARALLRAGVRYVVAAFGRLRPSAVRPRWSPRGGQ